MRHAPISRARYVQANRKMRFKDALDGWIQARLTQAEAALLLGQRERSFRRHIERCEANDPVRAGLAASLAHPGGQTTGTASLNIDLVPICYLFSLRLRRLAQPATGAGCTCIGLVLKRCAACQPS